MVSFQGSRLALDRKRGVHRSLKNFSLLLQVPMLDLFQSGEQLLEVLIESLRRLEDTLQGTTPAARDIWDKVPNDKFHPVDENAYSDYVKRHLERETQVRRHHCKPGG